MTEQTKTDADEAGAGAGARSWRAQLRARLSDGGRRTGVTAGEANGDAAGAAPASRRATLAGAVTGLCLGLLALGPGLLPGYLLSYDMVFVPRPAFNGAVLGTSGTLPRAVPSDAVVAALARLLPADAVQKGLLLAIFVLACAGTARLLARGRVAQPAAGGPMPGTLSSPSG